MRKRTSALALLFTAGLLLTPAGTPLHARSALTPEAVREALAGFEDALNLREGRLAALRFLNGHIGDRAHLSFAGAGTIDKEGFINAALFDVKALDSYSLALEPARIAIDREGVHADVTEMVTEQGAPVSGLSFTRIARCESRYALAADGSLILAARACHDVLPKGGPL